MSVAGLNPDFAFATETADKTFTGEEQGFVATNFGDLVIHAFGEGDYVAGIYDVILFYIDFNNRAVGVKPQITFAARTN